MRTRETDGVKKTTEDYLEAILMVREKHGYVRSIDLAEQLGVTKPSVTYTTKRLKEKGYITTDHAGMLVLTKEGLRIAKNTYERHKNLTEFLMDLGVSEKNAAADACLLEHDLCNESYRALCRHVEKNRPHQQQA